MNNMNNEKHPRNRLEARTKRRPALQRLSSLPWLRIILWCSFIGVIACCAVFVVDVMFPGITHIFLMLADLMIIVIGFIVLLT